MNNNNHQLISSIVDICNIVSNLLGKGFNETIYHEAICTHLRQQCIPYSKEVVLQVEYNSMPVGNVRADIVLPKDNIVIECKAIESELREAHLPQIVTYMNILNYNFGIFVNFIQHPSKAGVQTLIVEKSPHGFTFYDTSSRSSLNLDNQGNCFNEIVNVEEWFQTHIEYDGISMLSKSDCKALFPSKNNGDIKKLVECIETQCGEKFKDRQINGVKHSGTILGWKLT